METDRTSKGGFPPEDKEEASVTSNGNAIKPNEGSKKQRLKSLSRLAKFSKDLGLDSSLGVDEVMMILNPGTEEELEVWGYKRSVWRLCLTLLFVMLTCGLLGLILYWFEHLWLYCTSQKCKLANATTVLVMDHFKGLHTTRFVKKVKKIQKDDLLVPLKGEPEYKTVKEYRYFNVKKHKYIWDSQVTTFFRCNGLDRDITLGELHTYGGGLTEKEGQQRAVLYGKNEIKVPVDSVIVLLVKEILTPFYVFQVFSICFWYADEYWMYASAILITSLMSLSAALYNTRTNQHNLRDTIVTSEAVNVFRPDGSTVRVMSSDLVPGDLIEVPDHGGQMLCDAVLLEGQAIMNESMLTGESVPITKTSCAKDDQVYTNREHEKHTLKCGTEVIQTRRHRNQRVKAVVIRTGYLTTKGDLVRSILYPPPVDFQFETDSYKFVMVLAGIATIGMIYTLVKMVIDEESAEEIILEVFDLITIVVPPALPAAMTIGVVIAQQRLRNKNIFCISPRTINVAGSLNCVCFDKTGTITEDGMDMWGVIPNKQGLLNILTPDLPAKEVSFCDPKTEVTDLPLDSRLLVGMAVCHELSNISGKVMGDPLDMKIFESTGWSLEQDGEDENQIDRLVIPFVRSSVGARILQAAPQRLFQFSSDVQCMSVVCRVFEEQDEGFSEPQCVVYCKGSPEKIRKLCLPESVPEEYAQVLDSYASHGYRILAVAFKYLTPNMAKMSKINKMVRSDAESDLSFLGLVILENRLKQVSGEIIQELHGANIRPVMVTGDNILTAVSVARDCGLVPRHERVIQVSASMVNDAPKIEFRLIVEGQSDTAEETPVTDKLSNGISKIGNDDVVLKGTKVIPHSVLEVDAKPYRFATDGTSFAIINSYCRAELLPYLVTKGAVFARMRPDMKQQLVEILQDLGYFVGMCGDGANDCGALKAAHAGISLSEAEASVASPFTSKTPDISCVPLLIKEGRAALVTSFGIFKYMAAYSITQFASVMILYEIYSNLSDSQFLYVDLFIITTLAAAFGLSGVYEGPLAKVPPMNSLISPVPIFSLFSQLLIAIGFQICALLFIQGQSWFVSFDYENPCYFNTSAERNYNASGLINLDKCTADDDPVASYENYAVFSVSQFQYIILVIAFAKGAPYRQAFYRNKLLMIDIVLLTSFSLYITIDPHEAFVYYFIIGFELFLPPRPHLLFRLKLVGLVVANTVTALLCEIVIADFFLDRLSRKKNKKYNKIEEELDKNADWPPLGNSSTDMSPPQARPNDSTAADVFITDKDVATISDAFDSLFSTPGSQTGSAGQVNLVGAPTSHVAAAIHLNPPPCSPRKATSRTRDLSVSSNSDLPMSKSSESTPCRLNLFYSALSTPVGNSFGREAMPGSPVSTNSPSSQAKYVSCDSVLYAPTNAEIDKANCLSRPENKADKGER